MQTLLGPRAPLIFRCAHSPCSRDIGTRTAVLKDGRIYCCLDCAASASAASPLFPGRQKPRARKRSAAPKAAVV
jgi:hypothetical protein